MSKKFSLRKAIALVLAMVCMFAMPSMPAFAAETPADNTAVEAQVARAVQTNQFILNSNSATATVQLTRNVTAGSTTKTYQVVKTGSNCIVVVRFVNQSTNNSYTLALTANGGQYTEGIGVTIPAGTYTVSFASVPCTVLSYWCVFNF